MDSEAQIEATLKVAEVRRADAVAKHLATIASIGRMVDQLGELHCDLAEDDRLQQVLGSLSFLWGHVEDELLAAAKARTN